MFSSFDTSYFPLASLLKGEKVRVYGKQGTRYFVRYTKNMEERTGWVEAGAILVQKLVRPEDTVGKKKTYSGTVVGRRAMVRKAPDIEANVLTKFKEGDRVQVLSQNKEWYRLRLEYLDGSVGEGWIEKPLVRLDTEGKSNSKAAVAHATGISAEVPARPNSAVVGPREPTTEPATATASAVEGGDQNLRLGLGPVFNIHRYGTTQFRIGAAYEHQVAPKVTVGVPFSYAMGGGFSDIQGGVDLAILARRWGRLEMIPRVGALLDYYYGNDRSFIAVAALIALRFEYRMSDGFSWYMEPVSAEVSPYATEGVPWFVRGQALLGGKFRW